MMTERPRLPEECLCLASGLLTTSPPSDPDIMRASKLLSKVETHVKAFLRAEVPEKWECWQRPPEQSELRDALIKPLDHDMIEEDHNLDAEVLAAWALVTANARKYVLGKWPVYDEQSLEPASYDLAPDEYADIWEIVRAVDGIENLFGDLRSHVLSYEQVEAAKACFPDFMATVDDVMFHELSDHLAKKRKITWQQEDMIRVLRSLPGEEPITVNAPPPRQKKQPGAQTDKAINQMRTQAERVDAGEANR
jgi:hypothetical protein